MRKLTIYLAAILIAVITIRLILNSLNIFSSNLLFENIMNLAVSFIWTIPIMLILLIRNSKVKYWLLGISITGLLFLWFPFMFFGSGALGNLQSGKGYQKVFEEQIDENEYFCIYRVPDNGALGGEDWIDFTIEKPLKFGFVKRHVMPSGTYRIIQDAQNGTSTITFKNHTITYKNAEVL